MQTVEMKSPQKKNRDKVSEMQTVEMKSPQKNRDKVSEMKTFEIKVWQGMIKENAS